MFQSFDDTANPEAGAARLAALREAIRADGLNGFLVPRADAHQGEYVAERDARLAWLTGFTGSAGFCVVLPDIAGVFVDGRYRVQVKVQVDTAHFTPVDWPDVKPADWLKTHLTTGGTIGFDPWLYTSEQIEVLEKGLKGTDISLRPHDNLIDRIWADQPAAPQGQISPYPIEFAGREHAEKRIEMAAALKEAGEKAAVITLPDSIAWMLNIRGSDIPRNPVPHCFAVLHDDARVSLFIDDAKLSGELHSHLGKDVHVQAVDTFGMALRRLQGPVRLDKSWAPVSVRRHLDDGGIDIVWGDEPPILPKACKHQAEITATREAHLRDGAALCEFLTWFDAHASGTLTEIDIVTRLEECRAATGKLLDISFDTIAGSGPHGALAHYRVTQKTNRRLEDGDLLVLDGGGQFQDGTTDITRTLPVGNVGTDERAAFTRVLQGMIAISRLRWPEGLAGRDLDAIARYPLWLADQDYAHGTGHGVGVALCVHEGPQRLSRISHVPFKPGMIVSNEPGYYREGAFGIRIENLLVVTQAERLEGGDQNGKLCFETLNWVPIDRRLIDTGMLSEAERDWLNDYHATCRDKIGPRLSEHAAIWLDQATAPLQGSGVEHQSEKRRQ